MINKENNKKYFINENYCESEKEVFFDDTPYKDEYQDEVYKYALGVFNKNKYNSVLDIGCGSGFKLLKYFNEHKHIGVDLPKTILWLKNKYPNNQWETFESLSTFDFDLIICSDVIEHIYDVDILINFIKKINFKTLVLSTPERLTMYGFDRLEKPANPCHVREWSFEELENYCKSIFLVENHIQTGNTQIIEIKNTL